MADALLNRIGIKSKVLFAQGAKLIEGNIVKLGRLKLQIEYQHENKIKTIWKYPDSIIKHESVDNIREMASQYLIDELGLGFTCEECGTECTIFTLESIKTIP